MTPNALSEEIMPMRSGASPALAVSSGPMMGRLWSRKEATLCIPSVVDKASAHRGTFDAASGGLDRSPSSV